MSSDDILPECDTAPSSFLGADVSDLRNILGNPVFDYRCLPLTVDETLLEVELSGPGSEAIRLLETLDGRWLDEAQSLQVAAAWERQARWLSTRSQAANLAFVGTAEDLSRDGMREQSSRTLELALATDCNDTFLKETLGTARTLATTLAGDSVGCGVRGAVELPGSADRGQARRTGPGRRPSHRSQGAAHGRQAQDGQPVGQAAQTGCWPPVETTRSNSTCKASQTGE